MKRSRFSEEQIIGILKERQAGLGAKELCRKHGISDATFYKWRTNGQVERMNRTIKEATVKRFHLDSHDQLRTHLADFMAA